MKWTRVIGSLWFAWMALFAVQVHAQESLCAVVKIEIAQELTLERQAFEANMRITNSLDTMALENVNIRILFEDSDGNEVVASSNTGSESADFFIDLDGSSNINSVQTAANGQVVDGKIDPAQAAELRWLIIPTAGAGGSGSEGKLYYVGAELSFTYGGESQTIEVSPDTIVVKPQPNLVLDYFLPAEVNGDNPFTPEIEPVEPYNLGVRLSNTGSGAANAVKIQSAQPKIVENERGLLVDFLITGSFVDDDPAEKTLLTDFGTVPADSNTTGRWIMETSLTGRFTDFGATLTHADEFGGELTSLVEAVNTHFLVHDVLVDLPGRDSVRDFLAIDGNTTRLYESENIGEDLPLCNDCRLVSQLGGTLGSASSSGSGISRSLSTETATGPVHIKVADPYEGDQVLSAVRRQDGSSLAPANYWLSKTIKEDKINYDYFLNVFDHASTGPYTLIFGGESRINQPPVLQYIANYTTYETGQVGFLVQASDPDNDTPEITAGNLPAGASFNDKGNGQGVFSWSPQPGQAGSYTPVFTASDGQLTAQRSTTIRVNPTSDRDGDGMDDDWEMENFGDLSRDGTGDFDGDGVTDLEEFERDSNPLLAEVAPAEPQLDAPAYDAEVTSQTPTLRVVNGEHAAEVESVYYTFELYKDQSLNQPVAVVSSVAEGVGSTELTVESGLLSDNTEYFWRANARTAAGASDWVNGRFFVNTANDAPAAFTVSKPTDQTLVDTLTPTLVTNNSADIDGDSLTYQFQVFAENDPEFSDPVAQVSGLAEGGQGQTAWKVSTPLTNGQLYLWVAVVTDEHGASALSEPASFIVSTENLAPTAPETVNPAASSLVSGNEVALEVANAEDPERQALNYWFEIDTVNTFDSPNLQTSGAVDESASGQTQWLTTGLQAGQQYFWRVKADDGEAQSEWSTSEFRTISPAQPPTTPTLNNPADQAWIESLSPTLSVHPSTDPNGDSIAYEFELYEDEGLTTLADSASVDTQNWALASPIQNHQTYFWRVRAVDSTGLASDWTTTQQFFTNEDGIDDAPTLSFVLPDANLDTYGGNVEIQWVDRDPDSDARISLYYNDDQLIVADLPENPDGEGDRYSWNIDSLPVGTYTLSAVIDDGVNSVTVDNCCVIQKSDREIAAKVTPVTDAVTDETGLTKAAFDVVLEDPPRAGTTVLLNLSVSDESEGQIVGEQAYLEFTDQNWSVPQTVEVVGKDDCEIDGDSSYYLQFSPAVSADPTYEGTLTPAVEIINQDSEEAGQTLFVCDYDLQSQASSGDRVLYTYKARLNNEAPDISSATAAVQSLAADQLVSGTASVAFPSVQQGSGAWSIGTFVLALPAGISPNTSALAWTIDAKRPSINSSAPGEGTVGEEYQYQVVASGDEGDTFTYSLISGPEGMTIDPATGLVQWTPDVAQQGSFEVVVQVVDQSGGIQRQAFAVDIAPAPNDPRVYIIDPAPGATADYDSLAAAIGSLPPTFDRPVILRARSSDGSPDTAPVTIDQIGATAERPLSIVLEGGYQLSVTADAPGTRAIAVNAEHVQVVGEGGKIIVRSNGFDDVIGIEVTEGTSGSEIYLDQLTLRGEGSDSTDSFIGIKTATRNQTVVVRNADVAGFRADARGYGLFLEGRVFAYNNTLVDNSVGLAAIGMNARLYNNLAVSNGVDFSSEGSEWRFHERNLSSDESAPNAYFQNQQIEFMEAPEGDYALAPWDDAVGLGKNLAMLYDHSFRHDNRGNERGNPWDVGAHVAGEVANRSPIIESDPVVEVVHGEDYQYQVVASDPDRNSLDYRLDSAPFGMTVNRSSGNINWSPELYQIGAHEVSILVRDNNGGTTTQTFELSVLPAPEVPAKVVQVDTAPGTGADFASLGEAVQSLSGTLSEPVIIRAKASGGQTDTMPVVIDGLETSEQNDLTIVFEPGYEMQVDASQDDTYGIRVRDAHVHIRGKGGVIRVRNNGYDAVGGIIVEQQTISSTIIIDAVRVYGDITGEPSKGAGISGIDPMVTYVLRNNIVRGFTGSYLNYGIEVHGLGQIYNNTTTANRVGLRMEGSNSRASNNLSVYNQTDYESWRSIWLLGANNVTSDNSSPTIGARNRDVKFVDATADNFALSPSDYDAKGRGSNLSVANIFFDHPFNEDADGNLRTDPWDIGALNAAENP